MSKRGLLVLFILFLIAFVWADGGSSFRSLPQKAASLTFGHTTDESEPGWTGRVYRVLALKSAVQLKVGRTAPPRYTRLENIAVPLQQAIVAVEDNRFYTHMGVDLSGVARAALVNLQFGSVVEGGSTITQQLAKNLFLSHDQTMGRKAEEVMLALDLELRYSKAEILELYLNTIYFGSGANGITEAARVYFDKRPADLSLAESSLLAGLPNAPSLYSPYVDYRAAKQRQSVVLAAMVKYGYIDMNTAEEVQNTPLRFAKSRN